MVSPKLISILKRIGFDNSTLVGRVIFQKSIYILKCMGLDLGYNFKFYIYGPYSSELATEGYNIEDIKKMEDSNKLESEDIRIINNFNNFIFEFKDNPLAHEMLGTLLWFLKEGTPFVEDELYKKLVEHHEYLKDKYLFDRIIKSLKNHIGTIFIL